MTLIVYKKGYLAADSRATYTAASNDRTKCAHCDEKTHNVADESSKLIIPKNAMFRKDKVLAGAGAGNETMIHRLRNILRFSKDIEEVFNSYLQIHGSESVNNNRCSMLLICEKKCYIVRIPEKGELTVEEHAKDTVLAIGSGKYEAEMINAICGDLSAMEIINIVMARDKGIGGQIHYANTESDIVLSVPHDMLEPQAALDKIKNAYIIGVAMVEHEEAHKRALADHRKQSLITALDIPTNQPVIVMPPRKVALKKPRKVTMEPLKIPLKKPAQILRKKKA